MNTRKDNNGKALAAWKKLGVGHIAKPLKHIIARTSFRTSDGKLIRSIESDVAQRAANRGDGLTVQRMALSLK